MRWAGLLLPKLYWSSTLTNQWGDQVYSTNKVAQ